MRLRRHFRVVVAIAITLSIFCIRTAIAGPTAQPERLRDIDALIGMVHRLAAPTPPQDIDIGSIAIVRSFAIVEWFAQETRRSIPRNSRNDGGTFVARKSAHKWLLVRRLPDSYGAATLTRLVPGLPPATADALIYSDRIGSSLQGCNRDGTCSSTAQEIAFAVIRNGMNRSGFGVAPVVAPIVRDGSVALAEFSVGEGGGEALLQQKQSRWHVVAMGGGSMNSVGFLASGFRLPLAVARTLVTSMKKDDVATYSGLCTPKGRCDDRARSASLAFTSRFATASSARRKAIVRAVAIAGKNALLYYGDGKLAGQALLRLRNNRWQLRAMGAVSLADSGLLVRTFGISPANAARLAYKMNDLVP